MQNLYLKDANLWRASRGKYDVLHLQSQIEYTCKGESIENQVEVCKDYLFSHVKDIDEKDIVVYEDEGLSCQ